ncbi:MAG: NAD(P)H-dependent oxidoreductase [Methanobacteriota archaeon]
MNILLILAHPNSASLNHALADAVERSLKGVGHTIWFHDLYKESFDPILSADEIPRDADLDPVLSTYCQELIQADGIVIVHPNWWGQPPAILTGWVDRVIRPGIAYQFEGNDSGEGVPRGLLRAQTALVINTSNTGEYRENEVFGDPLERIWKDCIFGLCGVNEVHRLTLRIVVTSTQDERIRWIREVRDRVICLFPPGS